MSITQKEVVEYLLDMTLRHQLLEQAMRNCDVCFSNANGEIDGWIFHDLEKQFFSHTLVFKSADWDLIHINTCLKLLASNGREIGHYCLITTLEGETDDDYLVLALSKDDWENDRVATVSMT
jgi:hypothetical protein